MLQKKHYSALYRNLLRTAESKCLKFDEEMACTFSDVVYSFLVALVSEISPVPNEPVCSIHRKNFEYISFLITCIDDGLVSIGVPNNPSKTVSLFNHHLE